VSGIVLALSWERPWGLALLVVPVALLLLALRARVPRVLATSDLDVWRTAEGRGAAARPRRPRRVTLALLLALLALACAALAVAAPVAGAAKPVWTCVLDTSASMELGLSGATRRERAVAAALDLARRSGAELRWIAPALGADAHPTVDAALRSQARVTRATSFAAWDVPGALWVTDAVPAERPRHAGYVACGGDAVPGPVAVEGPDRLDWDGARLVRVPGAAPARFVLVDGLDVHAPDRGPLARVLVAWADARSASFGIPSGGGDVALRVEVSRQTPKREFSTGRDGWTAGGLQLGVVRLDRETDLGLEPWLVADGEVLVAGGAGRVVTAWLPGEPSDPAAFAVSWARLLDACAAPPPGIVPLEERVAAGPGGEAPPAEGGRARPGGAAWGLAVAAAVLALGALLARRS